MKAKMTAALVSGALISAAGLLVGFAPRVETTAPAAAEAYAVDGVHSSVMFRVKHQNVAFFYGRFNTVSGSFNLDEANPSASTVEITIDAESIDSANDGRDKHLKSPDFFSTKEFPTITFKSTSVESKGEKKYLVKGDMTLKGVTKAIEVTIEDTGRGAGRGGAKLAGIESVFTIKRSDFGMNYMVGPLGDEVTIHVGLEGKM